MKWLLTSERVAKREPSTKSAIITPLQIFYSPDEMYAAIEDPNLRNLNDIYNSGSETYAQIQPTTASNAITISVEINSIPDNDKSNTTSNSNALQSSISSNSSSIALMNSLTSSRNSTHFKNSSLDSQHIPPPISQLHTRQASSSSNASSMANIGSPKPEKRQANSPLPPTPTSKNQTANSSSSTLSLASTQPSGRNSVASVIEVHLPLEGSNMSSDDSHGLLAINQPSKPKTLSPSKDLEGMYAKVMKKNKLSHLPSAQIHNDAPVPSLTVQNETNPPLVLNDIAFNDYETIDKRKQKSLSMDVSSKDHGYETIPGDKLREKNEGNSSSGSSSSSGGYIESSSNRKSDSYAVVRGLFIYY